MLDLVKKEKIQKLKTKIEKRILLSLGIIKEIPSLQNLRNIHQGENTKI